MRKPEGLLLEKTVPLLRRALGQQTARPICLLAKKIFQALGSCTDGRPTSASDHRRRTLFFCRLGGGVVTDFDWDDEPVEIASSGGGTVLRFTRGYRKSDKCHPTVATEGDAPDAEHAPPVSGADGHVEADPGGP